MLQQGPTLAPGRKAFDISPCGAVWHGGPKLASQADLRRFFSGKAGPDEYQTLADLPPIPPSFDEPADADAPGQEDSP